MRQRYKDLILDHDSASTPTGGIGIVSIAQ
jgi:hypothetical protein